MNRIYESGDTNVVKAWSVKIPFSPFEAKRLRLFLKGSGRKAGPWLRTLAIKAMDEEQARNPSTAESGGAS